jgi:hypothetical protein
MPGEDDLLASCRHHHQHVGPAAGNITSPAVPDGRRHGHFLQMWQFYKLDGRGKLVAVKVAVSHACCQTPTYDTPATTGILATAGTAAKGFKTLKKPLLIFFKIQETPVCQEVCSLWSPFFHDVH